MKKNAIWIDLCIIENWSIFLENSTRLAIAACVSIWYVEIYKGWSFKKFFRINLNVSWFKFSACAALCIDRVGFSLKSFPTSISFSLVVFFFLSRWEKRRHLRTLCRTWPDQYLLNSKLPYLPRFSLCAASQAFLFRTASRTTAHLIVHGIWSVRGFSSFPTQR